MLKLSLSFLVAPAPFSVAPAPFSVVPAPFSVVPAEAGTQNCAENSNKPVVLNNVFLGPCLRRDDGERGRGDEKRKTHFNMEPV